VRKSQIEDEGLRIEEMEAVRFLNPQSSILNPPPQEAQSA
jgi:hypothetical protein